MNKKLKDKKSVTDCDPYGLPIELESKRPDNNSGILSITKDLLCQMSSIKTMFLNIGTGNRTGKKTRKF